MKVRCKSCGQEFETTWNLVTPVICKCDTVIFFGTYLVVNKEASGRKFGKKEKYYIETNYRDSYFPDDKMEEDRDIPILIYSGAGEQLVQRKLVWVAVVISDKQYGGPEEGGWWYDTQVVLERHRCYDTFSVTVELYHLLRKYKGKQGEYPVDSVLSEGKLEIIVSDEIPRDFPKTKPYYE